MSSSKDWNIQQRIKQDQKFGAAEDYAKKMQDIANNSHWHDRQERIQSNRMQGVPQASMAEIQQEVRERRKARMRQLLETEAAMYERELAARGLAIYRDKL